MFRLFTCGLLVVLAPCLVLAQDDPGKKVTPGKDLKIAGKLSENDPRDKVFKKCPHKLHEVQLRSGKVYVIDLSSKDFDPLLRLEDPDGKQVALNDDAGPDTLDSRIVHKATRTGSHKIIATCLDTKRGDYVLTVRRGTEEDLVRADPFYGLIGKAAPEITAAFAFNGDTKRLSDLKGKVVLLDFWAVWCVPCIQTFPHLREWSREYKKGGLEILGVTTYFEQFGFDKEKGRLAPVTRAGKDGKKEEGKLTPSEENAMLRAFAAHHQLSHRLAAVSRENWQKAAKDYRITGIPHAVVIDRKGIVRMVRVGSGAPNAEALHEEIKNLIAER